MICQKDLKFFVSHVKFQKVDLQDLYRSPLIYLLLHVLMQQAFYLQTWSFETNDIIDANSHSHFDIYIYL